MSSSGGGSGAAKGTESWLQNQEDPSQFAVIALTDGSNALVLMESQVANAEQGWAVGASGQTTYLDGELNTFVSNMASATGSDLQKDQSKFQALQTAISNMEQNYGNVVQGGTTTLNSVQQAQQQFNSLTNTPIQQKGFVNNLIMSWG